MRWIAVSLCMLCGCASSRHTWKAEVKPLEKTVVITVQGEF